MKFAQTNPEGLNLAQIECRLLFSSAACGLLFFFLLPALLSAQVTTYAYAGNPYNAIEFSPTTCPIKGSFTTPAPIPPNSAGIGVTITSYSFTDCVSTVTNVNAIATASSIGGISTDNEGNITKWIVTVEAPVDLSITILPAYGGETFTAATVSLSSANAPAPLGQFDIDQYLNAADTAGASNLNQNSPGSWTCSPSCLGQVNITSAENPGQGNPSEPQSAACQSCAGDPVNTAFGTFSEHFDDFFIPGRGMPLMLAHTYDSVFASINGPLGFGWTHSYDMNLVQNTTTGAVTVNQENGSEVSFSPVSGGGYSAPPRVIATLVKNTDGTFLFTRRAQQFFTFSSGGQLISEHDRNGYKTTLAYNGSGQLVSVTDPAGRALTFTYSGPKLTSVSDPVGRKVAFTYDANGNLSTVTDVAGGITSFTYSTSHLLLTTTDARKGVVANSYDSTNRVISQADQLGRKTTFFYSTGITKITDPKGNITEEQYNQSNQRVVLIRGFGTTSAAKWQFAYDPSTAALTSMTDPNGHISTTTYDASGNPLKSTDELGRVTTRTWDAMNDLTSTNDPLGVTTTLTYDANGNLLTRKTPLTGTALIQTYTYRYGDTQHPGDVTGIVDPDAKTETFAYDAYGKLSSSTDPLGHITKFSNNGIGWLTALTDARGKTTTYAHNNFGDLTVTTDALGHQVTRGYDRNRNLTSFMNADGHLTSFTYDAANERTTTTRADGTKLQAVYNADGTVAKVVNAAGSATTYGYDPLARPTSIADPLGHKTTTSYDGVGNQRTLTDPAGQVTTKSYDAANELISISYSDGKTAKVTLVYDADGQRTSMIDGTGTSLWKYDSLHRVISTATGAGAAIVYSYDLKGQLTNLRYPGGIHKVTRSYDSAGRLISIVDWLGNKTTFSYDANGNLTAETLPTTTSLSVKLSYDADSRLSSITDVKGTTNLASFAYMRDAAGLLTGATEFGVPLPGTNTYGYTPLDQLSKVNAAAYSYDTADDVTALLIPSQVALRYNTADELATLTVGSQTTTFSFDARGNRLQRSPPSGSPLTYAYDQANRMTKFGSGTTYGYTGDGLRMRKIASGQTEGFTWDRSGALPLLIVDGTTSYVYGPDGLPLEQISSAGTPLFYLHDQLGSTRLLVSSSGAVQNSYAYDAYGNIQAQTGTFVNPFGYTGGFTDNESGLIYLRARFYDPATAQFLNRDPIGNSGLHDKNAYSYASANPYNRIDPSGLSDLFLFGGTGWGTDSDVRFEREVIPLVGYSSDSGLYWGGIAAAGVEVGGQQNYVATFGGIEKVYYPSSGQYQSNGTSIEEVSVGIEDPGVAGVGVGVGTYETTSDESGVFIFGSGGFLGSHGFAGFGFSVPSSPTQWTYPPNTGLCLKSPPPTPF